MVTAGYLEHSVNVGDLKLSYQEWGNPQAQPIIMLHGFGVSGHMFDEFADRMQDRYRLIAEAAYFRAERRGFVAGSELDDWLAAELEVDELLAESHPR